MKEKFVNYQTRCKKCKKAFWVKSKRNQGELCRNCYIYDYHKRKRIERVKNKCCAKCGNKVKPITIIPYRCKKCLDKIKGKKNQ